MLTAEPSSVTQVEGAPWWFNGILALVGGGGGVGAVYLVIQQLNRKGRPVDEPPPTPPPPVSPSAPTAVIPMTAAPMPTTADGQLELAKMLVAEIDRDRADLRTELEGTERKLGLALEEVESLKVRLADQAGLIAQLRMLVDRLTPPGQTPPSTV